MSNEAKENKPVIWLGNVGIEDPPFSKTAKREAGYLLRELQRGNRLGPPGSCTMPEIGSDCHEIRIRDQNVNHRIFYAIREHAIVILYILPGKKTQKTPTQILSVCKTRLKDFEKRAGD